MAGPVWIGIDLGETRLHMCVLDDAGAVIVESDCDSTVSAVEDALVAFPVSDIAAIGVEAGTATHLIRKLRRRDYPVTIFDARQARKFLDIRRSKTDASDARGLADLVRLGQEAISKVHLKSVEHQRLRSELVVRHKLVRTRVALDGSVRSLLTLYGRRLQSVTQFRSIRRLVEEQADALLHEEGIDLMPELEPLIVVCDSLRTYLKEVERKLKKKAADNPVCARFMEIPGVGYLCALSFYSAIEDPNRFERSVDVGAYFGLVPRRYQSGDVSRTLGITKTGNKLTRGHLVTAAKVMHFRGVDCALRDWGKGLRDRTGPGRANVAVARKLAVVMHSMWKNDAPFAAYPTGLARTDLIVATTPRDGNAESAASTPYP